MKTSSSAETKAANTLFNMLLQIVGGLIAVLIMLLGALPLALTIIIFMGLCLVSSKGAKFRNLMKIFVEGGC